MPDLGGVVWFTIQSASVRWDELAEWFRAEGVDESALPAQPSALDVFRAVTSDARLAYDAPWLGEKVRVRLELVEAASDAEHVERRLVRRVTHPGGGPLGHDEVAGLLFARSAEAPVTVTPVAPAVADEGERALVARFLDETRERCLAGRGHLGNPAVRGAVRRFVASLQGIPLRDGVYFVGADRLEEARRMAPVVARLRRRSDDGQPSCRYFVMPLPDEPAQRTMLADCLVDHVRVESRALLDLAEGFRAGARPPPPSRLVMLRQRHDRLRADALLHAGRLGLPLDDAPEWLGRVADALADLGAPPGAAAVTPEARQRTVTASSPGGSSYSIP